MAEKMMKYFCFVTMYQGMFPTVDFLTLEACLAERATCPEQSLDKTERLESASNEPSVQ